MMMTKTPRGSYDWCVNCIAWRRDHAELGVCRNHSPAVSINPSEDGRPSTAFSAWPPTMADDWCRDFTSNQKAVTFPESYKTAGGGTQ